MAMRGTKLLKKGRLLLLVLLLNVGTIGLFVLYFSPHLLGFVQTAPKQATVIAQAQASKMSPETPVERISGKPIRIKAPTIALDIPVVDGVYDASRQAWSLSSANAHYAVVTNPANNQAGNTFIYGHNRRSVFAALLKLQLGDKVQLETDNQKVFTYMLRQVVDVNPTDTSLFSYQGKPILTVQTCAGTWYEDRRLFTFDFVGVEDQVK
jgi:LPXTG-site transpeptidase (sortase) family protein